MGRHGLHIREPQVGPGQVNTLPSSIVPTATDPSLATATGIVSAAAPSGLTTVTITESVVDSQSVTRLQTRTRTVTDIAEYASLTSAAAQSAEQTASQSVSQTSEAASATSSASSSGGSSNNLGTLIPAIVVPIVVVLLASLGLFWFFMRRRAKRELDRQPEFVMAGKGEKLSSRSSSSRSNATDSFEKKGPAVPIRDAASVKSPPTIASEFKSPQIGVARPLTPQESAWPSADSFDRSQNQGQSRGYTNFSGPAPRPHTAGRNGPAASRDHLAQQARSRSNSTPGNRGPPPSSFSQSRSASRQGTAPSPVPRSGPSPVPRSGPSPVAPRNGPVGVVSGLPENPRRGPSSGSASAAFRFRDPSPNVNSGMASGNRAQAPAQLEAPGAYNGQSSISQYSPIVKDAPTKTVAGKRPPPPIQTSNVAAMGAEKGASPASPRSGGLTEENLRIARFANSSRLGYSAAEPSPSPKLPPPATRSQLIPRDSPKEEREQFFGGKPNSSPYKDPDRASIVSRDDDYEDIDAKSDISSLNEFERFDFGEATSTRTGSPAGGSLNYFAAHNSPAAGRGSPFGDATVEKW